MLLVAFSLFLRKSHCNWLSGRVFCNGFRGFRIREALEQDAPAGAGGPLASHGVGDTRLELCGQGCRVGFVRAALGCE